MTRPWSDIRAFYQDLVDRYGWKLDAMLRLVEQIEASPTLSRLHAWTSHAQLCIVQTPVTYPYSGPYLAITPLKDETLEFRLIDTHNAAKQWSRRIPGKEAFTRLERLTDELRWFPRATTL